MYIRGLYEDHEYTSFLYSCNIARINIIEVFK